MSSSSDTDSCQNKKVKTCHRLQKFKNSWLEKPEFKVWLRPVANNKYKGKCVLCNSEFVSELSTVKKHLNSLKHKNNIKAKKVCGTNILEKFVQSATTSSNHEENVKEAEIRLCGFLAEHNLSFLTMDHLSPLLSKIFPDSKIAKDLAVRRTKAKAIITNVISPSYKNDLANTLKETKFSVLTDESTDIGTMKSACIVVRYFNDQIGHIESSLWELTSVFNDNEDAGHQGTADHLFNKILHTFDKSNIPNQNIIGFASDGCNVMMGEFNSVASRFKNLCPGIFIFKCICHSLHLCSAQACKSLPKATEDLARNIYAFFKTSSKRQCDFKQFQMFVEVDIHKMLHPSQTRWLSLAAVVKRILEQCFTIPSQRTNISAFVGQACFAYFKVKIGDQDKTWAPHNVCKQCVEGLRMWTKGTRDKMPFGIPMVWREPKDHTDYCYFCTVKTSGYNKKNKCNIEYPNLSSAIRPVPHSPEIPVPAFVTLPTLQGQCDVDEESDNSSDMPSAKTRCVLKKRSPKVNLQSTSSTTTSNIEDVAQATTDNW
ncbi:hypothetical protein CBL_20375 [Carabus blaptoides fortunei]